METITKTQAAISSGRTVYTTKVKSVSDGMGKTERVIKKSTNIKLGKTVTRGKFKGFPIFTVTLEERATCTEACVHWDNCYGNNMPFATRYAADKALTDAMALELAELQRKHPKGFLVRLHVLGDFFSVEYVARWARWLTEFPALHVYGYTHHKLGTDIGDAVASLDCDRWKIRVSGALSGFAAISEDQEHAPEMLEAKQAFICPTQTGKASDCGACTLCWASTKPVVFLTH